jgi:hypothetical protein
MQHMICMYSAAKFIDGLRKKSVMQHYKGELTKSLIRMYVCMYSGTVAKTFTSDFR